MAATVERGKQSIPPEQAQRLFRFRSRHPCKRIDVAGVSWEYVSGGEGTEALLVLPGGLRVAEAAFPYIEMFEDGYRVIAPTYPTLRTMAKLIDGIAAILDAEQVAETCVFGQSYGGAVAQVLIQRQPARVKKLVLSASAPLIPIGWKKLLSDLLLPIVTLVPEAVVMGLFKRIITPLITVSESERAFWDAYLDELFEQRLTKPDLLSHLYTTRDAQSNYVCREGAQSDWSGRVLVIWGENDHLRTERAQRGMLAIYPQAKIEVIAGAGHTAALSEPVQYAALVKGFLEKARLPLGPEREAQAHGA